MTQLGEAVSPPEVDKPDEKEEEIKSIKIRISMFFDGTQNNRINTEHRTANDEIYKKYKKDDNSYENDLTNVAIMEKYIVDSDGYEETLSLYIEGPGTINNEKDKFFGFALGTGKSGIVEKVNNGISKALEKIKQVADNSLIIEKITIDSYGFSRGAAGARLFVYESLMGENSIKQKLVDSGLKVKIVGFDFIGLYDTVSSHGLVYFNDKSDLKLDSISHANRVVQLAAAEEHRERFSLTTIESAGPNGEQYYLPGVHSDIGGGYVDGVSENSIVYKTYNEKKAIDEMNRLIESGWFYKDEIKIVIKNERRNKSIVKKRYLEVTRKGIKNNYSLIPLNIMAEQSLKNKIKLESIFYSKYNVPSSLSSVKAKIDAYISNKKKYSANDWLGDISWQKTLRHDYLHFSAKYEIALNPRIENGKRVRKIYRG